MIRLGYYDTHDFTIGRSLRRAWPNCWVLSSWQQKSEISSTRRIWYAAGDINWRGLHVQECKWPPGAKSDTQLTPGKETGPEPDSCKIPHWILPTTRTSGTWIPQQSLQDSPLLTPVFQPRETLSREPSPAVLNFWSTEQWAHKWL